MHLNKGREYFSLFRRAFHGDLTGRAKVNSENLRKTLAILQSQVLIEKRIEVITAMS